jgi:inner membrane protein
MTGRTHDLAAFTTLTFLIAAEPLIHMSLATGLVALAANMIGGVAPDIDQPTGKVWHQVPAGTILGRLVHPFLGSHRTISHSILGTFIASLIVKAVLNYTKKFLIVDNEIVYLAFMLGYISHLVMDTFTKEGVPWLFPIPIKFGIPPIKAMRITTGKFIETILIFPGLLLFNGYLIYMNYGKFLDFIRHYVVR